MSKTAIFILLVVSWFGLNFARAASVEPTEANIEQLLAEKDAKGKDAIIENPAHKAVEELAVAIPETVNAKIDTKNAKESDIPVQLESKKGTASAESPVTKMLLSVLLITGLGTAAFFGIRRYKLSNKSIIAATQMKILAQHHLGPKKSLMIVRVAGESLLIGVTDSNISMLKSLALLDEDVPEATPRDFDSVFSLKNREQNEIQRQAEEGEEFALGGIKDFVSTKLKNMRSFE